MLERSDGISLPVSLSLNFITKKGFEVVCAIVTDLSGQKQVQEERRKLSQEFQTLLNAISETLILLSPEMEVLWTNGGNALELNETVSDPVGQYCYKLLHDRSAPSEDCPITRCFDTAEKEVAVVTHNGAVLDIRAFPIKEAERVSSVLLLVSDITEKMAMQAEAMQAGHMASLGELAAGVAHEINNPITGIINYGQILINECSPRAWKRTSGSAS